MKFIDATKLADTITVRNKYSYVGIIPAYTDTQSISFIPGFYKVNDKLTYCEHFEVTQDFLPEGIGALVITPVKCESGASNILGRDWWVCEMDFRIRNDSIGGSEFQYTTMCKYFPVEGSGYTKTEWVSGEKDWNPENDNEDVVENEDVDDTDTSASPSTLASIAKNRKKGI